MRKARGDVDLSDVKVQRSIKKILDSIKGQPRTRQGIECAAGVGRDTVNIYLPLMVSMGMVREAGHGVRAGRVGRAPVLYEANAGVLAPHETIPPDDGDDGLPVRRKSSEPVVVQRDPFTAAFFGSPVGTET